MRRKWWSIALVACLTVMMFRPAAAQCATGCSSSSACEGSGKASCSTACGTTGGVEWCSCTDNQCGTQLVPPLTTNDPSASSPFALADDTPSPRALLMVDCRGNVVDVVFAMAGAEHYSLMDLTAIELERRDSQPLRRIAAARPEPAHFYNFEEDL